MQNRPKGLQRQTRTAALAGSSFRGDADVVYLKGQGQLGKNAPLDWNFAEIAGR
jgi:hypothetical protein